MVGWFFGPGGLCWDMGGYVWGLGIVLGLGRVVLGMREVVLGATVWSGFGVRILGVCGWARAGQGGFIGWCVGVLGLAGGVGAFRTGFGGWGGVLGLGGLVLGLRGGDV